ncbi:MULTISPECIES: hypothetical protein [unclassified Nodularia (in: cyanobacteria)]|uniref:hypothetical protein n=1 Tax=unclassified Nodularia (in: cyanobacteria) TaxID=2656917 RepID=UPI001D103716|nr:hypothetical protein [Nodularia sp. LEGE 04288]MCC2695806.1 hypothetical protein [Nodularia sp. LEGE 04288]
MVQYCQIGETARVTLPNGSIQNYTDTPINITCEPEYEECAQGRVSFSFTQLFFGSRISNGGNAFFREPYGGIRINGNDIEILSRNIGSGAPCLELAWRKYSTYPSPADLAVTSLVRGTPFLGNRLIIIGASGALLLNELFDTCGYSVECNPGCPAGSLDCGDCCLNCDSIFNAISGLRAAVASLK